MLLIIYITGVILLGLIYGGAEAFTALTSRESTPDWAKKKDDFWRPWIIAIIFLWPLILLAVIAAAVYGCMPRSRSKR